MDFPGLMFSEAHRAISLNLLNARSMFECEKKMRSKSSAYACAPVRGWSSCLSMLMSLSIGSRAHIQRVDASGSPCLTPLVISTVSVSVSMTRNRVEMFFSVSMMVSTNCLGTPSLWRHISMYQCSIESKHFRKSFEIMCSSIFFVLASCIAAETVRSLCDVPRLDLNPDCASSRRLLLSRKEMSLLLSIEEYALYALVSVLLVCICLPH